MAEAANTLVLEIFRQESRLSMSVFEQTELTSTLRHYNQHAVNFTEVNQLCADLISILNKVNKRNAQESVPADALRKTAQLLWDHLLAKPVKDRLRKEQPRDLILLLDEELVNAPWELLHDGDNFLCLKFNLGRLVRTRQQANPPRYRSFDSALKMLILANPTCDLKSAYLEGIHIKNQFDKRRRQIRIDFKANGIDTFYVKKNLRDYDIVHFAGHCEYDDADPKETGWVLNNGKFTTRDILALGGGSSLPALVFSNACHSAQISREALDTGCQEKNYSLAAAFLFSGVRHYIGTIWKIEDPVSLVFAEHFYTHLINGEPLGQCVRLARWKLSKDFGAASFAWAGYLLYGNPDFVLFKAKAKPQAAKLKLQAAGYKKSLLKIGLTAAVITACLFLCLCLPTLNPDTYLLFLKSRQLFSRGNNENCVSLATAIVKKDPFFLPAYPLLADACKRLGRKEEALKYYFDYAVHSEKRRDMKNLASAYTKLGWFYQSEGKYRKAFEFYDKAITLSRGGKDKLNEASALRKLALWHIDQGDDAKALELLTKSSEINRERQYSREHRYNLACDYFDIGLVFINKNDYASAREFYQKSCRLFKAMHLENELSDYYLNLGEICLFEKQYELALEYYLRGLKIDEAQGNKPSIAQDYSMLGDLYLEMGKSKEAETYFIKSASLAKEISAPQELASAYYSLGLLYRKQNKRSVSHDYLRQAQEIYRGMDSPDYEKIKREFLESGDS